MSIVITFEGPEYYLYTLRSWLKEVEDIIREMTCIEKIEVVERISENVKIYLNNKLIFEGLPDAEWALAELIIHELRSQGYQCMEDQT
ncbi:MAG: hypothetical protein GXO10_01965 [Crenarchaeota archaeon]|nr:hypothetical protein [Thermoproteota archaeon]